jgi:hypothetical protein
MSRFDFKMSFDNIAIVASALIGSGVAALSDYSQKATSAATQQSRMTGSANQVKLSYALEKSPLPNFLKGLLEQRSF